MQLLPGKKTYILAAIMIAETVAFNAGLVPAEVHTAVTNWLSLFLTGTVGAKVYRIATGKDV